MVETFTHYLGSTEYISKYVSQRDIHSRGFSPSKKENAVVAIYLESATRDQRINEGRGNHQTTSHGNEDGKEGKEFGAYP